MTDGSSSVTRTILIRTTDGAGKAYTYVNTQPNLAFRIAMLLGLILGIALLVLVIIPFSIILILALFLLEIVKRAVLGTRAFFERKGVVSTKEGRKNVRVVDR
jgi:uncharacterized protein (DUF983 family)